MVTIAQSLYDSRTRGLIMIHYLRFLGAIHTISLQQRLAALGLIIAMEATITDTPARRTRPISVQQRLPRILTVAIAQARAAELTAQAAASLVATDGLHVERLLPTLVTARAIVAIPHLATRHRAHFGQLLLADVLGHADSALALEGVGGSGDVIVVRGGRVAVAVVAVQLRL